MVQSFSESGAGVWTTVQCGGPLDNVLAFGLEKSCIVLEDKATVQENLLLQLTNEKLT